MTQIINLLKQRRIWAGLVGFVGFILTMLGITHNYDPTQLTELLTAFGTSLAALIPAVLALLSYILPKK